MHQMDPIPYFSINQLIPSIHHDNKPREESHPGKVVASHQMHVSMFLALKVHFFRQWAKLIARIGYGCYRRRRSIYWKEEAWISGGRIQ